MYCDNCYLSLFNYKSPSRIQGGSLRILFVSEHVTSLEHKNNKIFTGRVSKILLNYIEKYKLDGYYDVTSVVRCVCKSNEVYEFANNCFKYTIDDVIKHKPIIIIPVGKVAYKMFKDNDTRSFTKIVNKPIKFVNSIMIPIHSPSYVKQNASYSSYVEAFELIKNIYRQLNPIYNICIEHE